MIPPQIPSAIAEFQSLAPIPISNGTATAGNYHTVPVSYGHPLYTEELVDIRDYGIAGIPYYFRADSRNWPYNRQLGGSIPDILVRKSVAIKLAAINARLSDLGIELFVWDAYRPLSTQKGIWDFFERAQRVKSAFASEEEIRNEVLKYVSDPNSFDPEDQETWPTHMTGGSVDLTLRKIDTQELLDMGARFDEMSEVAHTHFFEDQLLQGLISNSDERLVNRRLLYIALASAEFTNYPFEYWHFDWGNQMYQMIRSIRKQKPAAPAWYGVAGYDR